MPSLQNILVSNEGRAEVFDLSESGGISQSDIAADKELQATYRDLGTRSLYFFTKAILGYPDLVKGTHLPVARFMQDVGNRRKLLLLPRGCFKTTIGTIGFAIWYLMQFPNQFILIANQITDNAEKMLLEVEQHLDGSNTLMNWLWPQMIKQGDKLKPWNAGAMRLPSPFRSIISGTPSLMALGVGTRAESLHFHVIINDDLVGEKAMMSDREMLEAIGWHDYSVSLFVNPSIGIERALGTRWSLADLYAVMMEDPAYHIFLRQAVHPVTGKLFFPERLTAEFLREARERNYAHYMAQYMNDPENPEVLDFRPKWLKFYNMVKTNRGPACFVEGETYFVKDMDVCMAVDPAGSGDIQGRLSEALKRGRARKANNAVSIWGLHGSGHAFQLDSWAGRGRGDNPELEVATKMLEQARRWHGYCTRGYVEAYGAQRGLITIFNMVCRDAGFTFRMDEIPRGILTAKKVRIRTQLGPMAQNGQLHARRSHDQFIYEFNKYPQSDLYDTLDAAAWALMMLKRPRNQLEQKMIKARNAQRRQARMKVSTRTGY